MTGRVSSGSFSRCIAVLCLAAPLIAQIPPDIEFEHLSVKDGLSASAIMGLYQDSYGYLWVGTLDGLNRYDGYTFKNFIPDPEDPHSIAENGVFQMSESRFEDGTALWVHAWPYLQRFDYKTEQFHDYRHDPEQPGSLSHDTPNDIYTDLDGDLWVCTRTGLNRYNPDHDNFDHLLPGMNVRHVLEDSEKRFWVLTQATGLLILDRGSGVIERTFTYSSDISSLPDPSRFTAMVETGPGNYMLSTRGGEVLRFQLEHERFTSLGKTEDYPFNQGVSHIRCLLQDSRGHVWITSEPEGVGRYDSQTGRFSLHRHDPDDPHSLSFDLAREIIEDRSGVMWFGTRIGLNKWSPQKAKFLRFTHQPRNPKSLSHRIVLSIQETWIDGRSDLWIGTPKGLNRFDRDAGIIEPFIYDSEFPDYPAQGGVIAMCQDSTGNIWLGTWFGLVVRDLRTGHVRRFKHDPQDPHSLSNDIVWSLFCDSKGVVWVGTQTHLNRYDQSTDGFRAYFNNPYCIRETWMQERQYIWFATHNAGLRRLDPETDDLKIYRPDPGKDDAISDLVVQALHEDDDGILWVGTHSGLDRFDPATETFRHFTMEDGLPGREVLGIVADDAACLWLMTQAGLSRFDPRSETFRNYDRYDGLQGDELMQNACYKASDGMLLFGGTEGLTAFYPDDLRDNPHIPDILLTDFQVFHQAVPILPDHKRKRKEAFSLPTHISSLDELVLSYRENVFSLEFAALDFHAPEKNRYAYRLEGLEDDWVEVDASRRYVSYTNLDPGKYVFRVKGSNNDGLWNEAGRSLKIIITPPWWKSRGAYLGYILLILSMLYGVWRFQLSRINLRHQLELEHLETERYQEIDQLKTRFFTNISHEFRTPITLILGPIHKLLTEISEPAARKELNVMQRNAQRLNRLVSQLLDLSRIEAHSLKLQASKRNIIPLLKALTLSFASLAEKKETTLQFRSDLEDIQVYFERESITKVMSNLLSNAFKFTSAGDSITVDVSRMEGTDWAPDGHIEIKVEDTGLGIPDDRVDRIFDRFYQIDGSQTRLQEGSGIGLSLTQELVELHKGDIRVESQEDEGSCFIVRIPLGRGHLNDEDILDVEIEEEVLDSKLPTEFEQDLALDDGESLPPDEARTMILVVEDNADVREYVVGYLRKDYRIYQATNGREGLNIARQEIPDLILSDIMMPHMDGVELCNTLKADQRTSHIPVILLTAKADKDSRLEGLETGADDYIIKPFEPEELLVRIRNLLAQRERLRVYFKRELSPQLKDMDLSSLDEKFLDESIQNIHAHLDDGDFSVEQLAQTMHLSRRHLSRKLNALTGMAGQAFIRSVRLKHAARLLQARSESVTQIAYAVGFNNPAHFSSAFKREFGVMPSKYAERTSV